MADCLDCDDPVGSVVGFGPLPPCHENTTCFEWDDPRTTTPPGRTIGRPVVHPAGGITCLSDGDGDGLAVSVAGPTPTATAGTCVDQSPLRRDPTTNQLWALPYPTHTQVCVESDGCPSTVPGGDADQTSTGCAVQICATITNTSCMYPMLVVPRITVIGAELDGGPLTYEMVTDGGLVIPMFTNPGEPRVVHVPGDSVGHNVIQTAIATYSGDVSLAAVTVGVGQTFKLCIQPRVRYRKSETPATDVDWGLYRLCLVGDSIR